MKFRLTLTAVAGTVLLALLVLVAGCEDSDLTLSSEGAILISANPGTVTIDPNQGETEGTTTIIASVFDSTGLPMQNISVLFTTTGGTLASNSANVRTDANGVVTDTLTLTEGDPAAITVTAQSSVVSETVAVTLEVLADNEPPEAVIADTPVGEQEINKVVTFDGSLSLDPDGDNITCYQWVIDSNIDTYDKTVQGVGASGLQEDYPVEQFLSVLLRVSDRGDAGSLCDPAGPLVDENLFSPKISIIPYEITCANSPPTADAGPDISHQVGVPGQTLMDGCNSSDPEDSLSLDDYVWNCGNGTPASSVGLPACQAWCRYSSVGQYTATLTVYDKGNGTIDPGTGNWECQKTDSDEVFVNIFAPGGGD